MPQYACHAKSSTKLLQLNNSIVLANIADSKCHDPDDSNIVQGFALDRFAIFGNQRIPSQPGKLRPAAMLYKQLATLFWLQGDIQHNVTTRPLEEQCIRPNIADRVDGKTLLNVVRRRSNDQRPAGLLQTKLYEQY